MKIFIDPGHGGSNPGAAYMGRKESEDVYALAERVKTLLERSGVEVKLSRGKNDDPALSARTKAANDWNADYFLSIHRNAFEPNRAEGVEAWCYSKIERFGTTYNKALKLVSAISDAAGFINRGVKLGAPSYTDFAVNRETNMSSCLLEVGFIDSNNDNARFDGFFDAMSLALAKALVEANGGKWLTSGDIDGDGEITSADARTALRASVGLDSLTEEQRAAADMDGDGKISSADARQILRKSVNLDEQGESK